MPSHVAHLLFAEEAIARSDRAGELTRILDAPANAYLVLGAQGPDIFYHNQRRRPSGLAYGSLMHRRGYGTAVANMWVRARAIGAGAWATAWIIGFATHAVLDRHAHPYINSRSGWPQQGKPETDRFRSMHAFLERLIDVELLRRTRDMHPNDLEFFERVSCADEPPSEWVDLVAYGLRETYTKAAEDAQLVERLRGAFLDAMGYYRFTSRVDAEYLEKGLAREESGEIGPRWLSIVHPPEVPPDLDVLNEAHEEWPHPCSIEDRRTASFLDCYEDAVDEAASMIDTMVGSWEAEPAEGRAVIEAAVKNWNLSDGRPTQWPCPKHHSAPLPLPELQARMRESIRRGDGGRLP
ncbi:MAG TPA: zinc dependent phospholipase C family protein [Spirochaetia bacterium]|nr:zinc dependent phospholipase C family protein [Spirochaetia bacterium]